LPITTTEKDQLMSDHVLPTMTSSKPLALPRGLAAPLTWATRLLGRGDQPLDRSGQRLRLDVLFPDAIGATDLELARLLRSNNPEETLRQARKNSELEVLSLP
jgi:hypothetical protein